MLDAIRQIHYDESRSHYRGVVFKREINSFYVFLRNTIYKLLSVFFFNFYVTYAHDGRVVRKHEIMGD